MTYLSPTPAPPRLAELPGEVRDRLSTLHMERILGGSGRVYAATDDYHDEEAPAAPWGRVVVLIGRRLWSTQELAGRQQVVRLLVRAEVRPAGGGYDPQVALEAAHGEAFLQLEGWRPAGLLGLQVIHPFFRRSGPDDPVWDDDRGLWMSISEFRLVAGPA